MKTWRDHEMAIYATAFGVFVWLLSAWMSGGFDLEPLTRWWARRNQPTPVVAAPTMTPEEAGRWLVERAAEQDRLDAEIAAKAKAEAEAEADQGESEGEGEDQGPEGGR